MQGNYNWIDTYEKLLDEYNSSTHRTIAMKPRDVTRSHEDLLLNTVYKYSTKLCSPKFSINQPVRVSRYKSLFDKSFHPQWSPEIFTIVSISRKFPVTYILKDYKNQIIQGRWYESELQSVKIKDLYLVEKILKRKNNKVLCKWWGFSKEHSTWENEKNLV